jgi:hypothetical protein
MTVRQALKQMENKRLVTRRRGAGTFVAAAAEQFRTLNRLGPFEQGDRLGGGAASDEGAGSARAAAFPPPRRSRGLFDTVAGGR